MENAQPFEEREYYGKYRVDNYNDDEQLFQAFWIDTDGFKRHLVENVTLIEARAAALRECARDSAPAMLEALVSALDIISSDYTVEAYEYEPDDVRSQVQREIEAIIAKAIGK